MADLAPSLPSRTVTIDVLELDEATPAQGYISFVLPCDLYVAADDKIIQAMSKTVQLVDGKAAASLPCFSSAAVSQDGRTDWAIMVRKSWHPDHPYYIRVPSGTTPISLADIGPVRVLQGREKSYAITNVAMNVVGGPTGGTAQNIDGVLTFNLSLPAGPQGPIGPDGPANTLKVGTVTSGSTPSATITGTAPNQTISLVLPKGDKGDKGADSTVPGPTGQPNSLTIGSVTSAATPSAAITGIAPNQVLNLVLAKGDTGAPGPTGPASTSVAPMPTNLLANGGLEWGDARGWASGLQGAYQSTDTPAGIKGALTFGGSSIPAALAGEVAVTPGQELLFDVWLKADVAGSRISIEMRDQNGQNFAMWYDVATGANIGSFPISSQAVPTTWTKYSRRIVVPTGVSRVKIGAIYFNYSSGSVTNAVQSIAGMTLRTRATTDLITDGAVTGAKLATGAVSGPSLADSAVSAAKLASGAVSTVKIADGAVTSAKLDDASITSDKIADGAVGTVDIADGAITAEKIAPSVRQSLSIYTNVQDFGAKGDGTTDDTSAIKAAIAAAGGGTAFFPLGTYVVSDTLVQPDMQTWLGAGTAAVLPGEEKGSCIKAVHGGKAIVAMHRLDGLQVRGPGGVVNGQSVGIWSDGSALTLRDVSVAGFATGMSIDNVWYAHLDRVSLMQNSIGLSIDTCYNVTAGALRVYAQKDDGTLGTGINVTGGGSIRMTGGSIESYMYGIDLAAGTQAYCDGTYFETKAGTSGAVGIRASGAKITVSVEDCEVYMAGLAWVLFNGSTSGGNLVGRGSKFKSATTADATYAYMWSGGRSVPLVVTIAGDNWENVGTGPIYRTTGSASPGSQISDPTGVTLSSGGTGWTTINGSLDLYAGGIRAWNSARPTGLTSGNAGYFFYNIANNRIECWTGSSWVNAVGAAI